jgi:hypothetical protein
MRLIDLYDFQWASDFPFGASLKQQENYDFPFGVCQIPYHILFSLDMAVSSKSDNRNL